MVMTVAEPRGTETRDDDRWANMLRAWQGVELPDARWRAEIREEGIVMVPPPGWVHNDIAELIQRQLYKAIPDNWAAHQGSGMAIPDLERLRIPDLLVIPRAAFPNESNQPLPADEVLLAVEITSPHNANDDRAIKKAEYARAGVALYLLVDRYNPRGPSVTLLSDPRDGDYRDSHRVAFGEPIELPEPFDLKLDTTGFRTD